MRNALLFGFLLGIFVSSEGLIFPILFPVSIKLTIHRKQPEPAYQVQTIPVYKEVVKKDPSHDKEKHSYGDGYKGSSYGDGYPKTYSKDHQVKGHKYGNTYGSQTSKGVTQQAPVSYKGNGYVNIGATFDSNTSGKGTSYGTGLVSVKGTGYGGDLVSITGTAYTGDLAGVKVTGYGDDLGSGKGTSYGTSYGDGNYDKGIAYVATYDDSSKGTAIAGTYGDGAKGGSVYTTGYISDSNHEGGRGYGVTSYDDSSKGTAIAGPYGDVATYDDSSKGTVIAGTYGDGAKGGSGYNTGYTSDSGHEGGRGYGVTNYDDSSKGTAISGNYGTKDGSGYTTGYTSGTSHEGGRGYSAGYDDPSSGKSVSYTNSYSHQPGSKGNVPYSKGNVPYDASSGKSTGYSSGYGNGDGSKEQGYGNTYEQADVYSSHEYAPPHSDEETYVIKYPPSSYEERTDNLQFYAGFGSSIYGDSYAKIVYVPRPAHVRVSVSAYKH